MKYTITDKEATGYLPSYQAIADILGPAARVCEIGVMNGGSLLMWQDMFPEGLIAGVDFMPHSHWPPGTVRIVAEQTDPALPAMLGGHAPAWDLIVDDGCHEGPKTAATFGLLWPLVAPDGYYVIEDWFLGLPLWLTTGCWNTGPRAGSPEIDACYDPGMLRMVQDLLEPLDEPFRGACNTSGMPRETEVESVTYRYGLAIVHKYPETVSRVWRAP